MNSLLLNIRIRSWLVFTLFFTFNIASSISKEQIKRFNYISVKEGLSHNYVSCSFQDTTGLMWFATRSGMSSFDGSAFKNYYLEHDNTKALPGQIIAKTATIDNNATIFVGTQNGLFRFNRELDRYEPLLFNGDNGFNYSSIFYLYPESESILWAGIFNGLYKLNLTNTICEKILEVDLPVLRILRLNSNELIFHTKNRIYVYNDLNSTILDKTTSFLKESAEPENNDIHFSDIFLDNKNLLWVCTNKHGIHLYDTLFQHKKEVASLSFIKIDFSQIKGIVQPSDSIYILAVTGQGVVYLNEKLEVIDFIKENSTASDGLKNDNLSHIFVDKNQRLWISTNGTGIALLDPNLLSFEIIISEKNNDQSLGNNSGRSILEDHKGNIWFGTKRGISIFNPMSQRWRHFYNRPGKPNVIFNNNILTFCQINENEIWFSSFGSGINVYRFDSDKIQPINKIYPAFGELDFSFVSDLKKDSDGNIWVGRLQEKSLLKLCLKTLNYNEFPAINLTTIFESSWNKLYVSSNFRMWEIDLNNNNISLIKLKGFDEKVIRYIDCFAEYRDSMILFGTDGSGLFMFDPRTKTAKNLTTRDGLASNNIRSILIYEDKIWLSSIVGISVLDIDSLTCTNYTFSNGLDYTSFSAKNGLITKDRQILFGGDEGYIKVNPQEFKTRLTDVSLRLSDFRINNIVIETGAKDSPLDKELNLMNNIELRFNQNSFSFDFTSINFTNPMQDLFSWKLENFETHWNDFTRNKTANYTNIPAGNYIFKIRLSSLGMMQDERSLHIKILPPWWRSPWAFVLYILVILSIIFLLQFLIKLKYKEKHAKEKISFFINVAHDLRTPLTLIQTPLLNVLKNNNLNPFDKRYIDMAVKNSYKIHAFFNQLLDFQKADLKKMKVSLEKSDIVSNIKEISNNFIPLLTEKNIDFKVLADNPRIEFYYDITILEKIIYNLLSNAIKYCHQNGKIRIKIKVANNQCIIKVSDNGIGIPDNQKKQIFKRYFRANNTQLTNSGGTGVGLMLVKQLVELLNGKIDFESTEGQGSEFIVTLKILNSATLGKVTGETKTQYHSVFQTETSKPKEKAEAILEESSRTSGRQQKIIIAEDNPELLNFLSDAFKNDYNVLLAENGLKALELARKYDTALIISDIMMPEMDGRMLCNEIKTNIETCHIPVILLTALSDADYRIEGYEAGADAYIEKPFDLNVLKSRAENLISTRLLLKEKFIKFNTSPNEVYTLNNLDSEFIQKAYNVVENNLNNSNFSIESFCDAMKTSRSILYRKIKSLTDLSPIEFVIFTRLKHASLLLKSGHYSVKEVAYKCGFSDPRYFSTIFKKHFNITPTEIKNDSHTEFTFDLEKDINIGDFDSKD